MPPNEISVRKAAELLGVSTRMVHYLIAGGTFPGARKINPDIEKASVVLPLAEVQAEQKRRRKAAQSGSPIHKNSAASRKD